MEQHIKDVIGILTIIQFRWIIPNITATMDLSVGDYIEMFIYIKQQIVQQHL